jgi:predicted component of type VI protein secretion system
MILRYRDHLLKINKDRRSVALGRDESCGLIVQNDFASRLHIRIELRFGKFIIADQSINGSYILFSDGNVVHITREEISLQGNGSISLGQSFAENPAEVVEFSVSSTHVQHGEAK